MIINIRLFTFLIFGFCVIPDVTKACLFFYLSLYLISSFLYLIQCSSCKNSYLGEPTDGHQCYSQMDVDSDYCFDPDDRNACGSNYKPLLKGRTLFYAVQPKYLNVNIRITIDVTQGGKI